MEAVIDRATLPLLARLSDNALAELVGQGDIAVSVPVGALLARTSPARFRQAVSDGQMRSCTAVKHVRVQLADIAAWTGRRVAAGDFRRIINHVGVMGSPPKQDYQNYDGPPE